MPSTYSPSLRLELMGAGDQSGNWGNTTNNNLGSLLEQAITGVGNITMLDATTTLVAGSGIVDEARNAVLVLGSASDLTANQNLIVPTVKKFYAVRNATSGGFSVVVKTLAGSGVTLANGFTQLMYCDGTNVVLASVPINSTNGNVAVSGNIAVSGNATVAGDMSVTGTVSSGGGIVMPTGSIIEYGGATAPAGWLLCNGSAVSRATYAALYAVLGDTYGAGDGSTTFNVPDRRNRVGVGAGSTYTRGQTGGADTATTSTNGVHSHGGATAGHVLTLGQMPAHNHDGTTNPNGSHQHGYDNNLGGSWNGANNDGAPGTNSTNTFRGTSFAGEHSHYFVTNNAGNNESHSHTISSDGSHNHTVSTLQPFVASNFIIKA